MSIEIIGKKRKTNNKHIKIDECIILSKLNDIRKKHGSPPLKLDASLFCSSKMWVEHLVATGNLKHSVSRYGENIAMFTGKDKSCVTDAIDLWYSEMINHDFSKYEYNPQSGHFTALIWRESVHVGWAIAYETSQHQKKTYIVMHFDPPGNIAERFEACIQPDQQSITKIEGH